MAEHLEALAAAWAENGNFKKAVETQRKAITAARLPYQAKKPPTTAARLSLYTADKAFRDDAAALPIP